MVDMDKLVVLVNSFGSALVSVSGELGVSVNLNKSQVTQGVKVHDVCAASLIGIVGGGIQGTAIVMLDKNSFVTVINAMSGGMIKPSVDDAISMSVIGELSNMVSGRALIHSAIPGIDVTPPQLIAGDNIRNVPSQAPGIRCFTLPFTIQNNDTMLYLVLSFHISK
ncbi:MAG: chemotaxis protein CheX [Synergistaceae bacterium]|nr:chemotaxis protein CheX [Synergistaceae bacterium]